MGKRWTYVSVALGVVVGCGVFFALVLRDAYNTTLPVAEAGEAFMVALQEQNLEAAYEMMAPAFRNRLTYANFEATFGGVTITDWTFNSRSIWNEVGELAGTATVDAVLFDVDLALIDNGTGWQLIDYTFVPMD